MIRICIVCDRVILGEADVVERFSEAGAGPNLYRHPQDTPGCVAQPARAGIAHRD